MQKYNNETSKYFFENFKGGRGISNKNKRNKRTMFYLIIFGLLISIYIYFINTLYSKSKK